MYILCTSQCHRVGIWYQRSGARQCGAMSTLWSESGVNEMSGPSALWPRNGSQKWFKLTVQARIWRSWSGSTFEIMGEWTFISWIMILSLQSMGILQSHIWRSWRQKWHLHILFWRRDINSCRIMLQFIQHTKYGTGLRLTGFYN